MYKPGAPAIRVPVQIIAIGSEDQFGKSEWRQLSWKDNQIPFTVQRYVFPKPLLPHDSVKLSSLAV
jgi:hypothetical protein